MTLDDIRAGQREHVKTDADIRADAWYAELQPDTVRTDLAARMSRAEIALMRRA